MIEGSAQNIDTVRKLNCPESTAQIEERNVEKKKLQCNTSGSE